MTWSYNTSSVASSSLYKCRLLVGDVETSRQQLQDEEINWVLSQSESVMMAAAGCCDLLAAKYLFQVNTENSELRISAEMRHKHYLAMADRYRKGGTGEVPGDGNIVASGMYVGGAVISEKQNLQTDSDLVTPVFDLGMDDNPRAADSIVILDPGGGFDLDGSA